MDQVVAVDRKLELLTRAWCVAELVEARASDLGQHIKLPSAEELKQRQGVVRTLDIRNCVSSFPEDTKLILDKIDQTFFDAEDYNMELRNLLAVSGDFWTLSEAETANLCAGIDDLAKQLAALVRTLTAG